MEIRLVKNFKGLSKGYGYVQFKDEVSSRLRAVQGRGKFKSMCSSRTG